MKYAVILGSLCLLAATGLSAPGEHFELRIGAQTPVSQAVLVETRSIIAARLRAAGVVGNVTVEPRSRLSVSLTDALPKRFMTLLTAPGRLVFRVLPSGPTYRVPGNRRALRIAFASIDQWGHHPIISFSTTDPASFHRLTAAHLNQDLGIYLDGRLLTHPLLVGAISDSGEIVGNFTVEDTHYYAALIGLDPLPAPVSIVGP